MKDRLQEEGAEGHSVFIYKLIKQEDHFPDLWINNKIRKDEQ